jgi:hypothetical protein
MEDVLFPVAAQIRPFWFPGRVAGGGQGNVLVSSF